MKGYQKQNQSNGEGSKITVYGNSLYASTDFASTCLSTEFWNNFLVIKITPFVNNNGNFSMDRKAGLSIHLNTKKAIIVLEMLNSIDKMIEEGVSNYSVRSGKKSILLSTGVELEEASNPVLLINEFNAEGALTSNIGFELNADSKANSIMVNTDVDTGNYESTIDNFVNNLDIKILKETLKSYIDASSKAHAFFNRATFEYHYRRDMENMNKIMDALGIRNDYSNKSTNNNSSFNSNSGNSNNYGSSSNSTTVANLDDI